MYISGRKSQSYYFITGDSNSKNCYNVHFLPKNLYKDVLNGYIFVIADMMSILAIRVKSVIRTSDCIINIINELRMIKNSKTDTNFRKFCQKIIDMWMSKLGGAAKKGALKRRVQGPKNLTL